MNTARESEIRFAIEEAVRLGLTAFAPTVISQLGLISEKEALSDLSDFSLAHPGELDCYCHAVCPRCGEHSPARVEHSTSVGARVRCLCELAYTVRESDLHWMFEPCGTMAVPIERWSEVKPTNRSRPSALAERMLAC